ncbi:MAG: acetolactate decarboxylase [Actinobacteria bacterium]|nr:MAG: acetolactate decarboxylase [Actinomycetota bacterium]
MAAPAANPAASDLVDERLIHGLHVQAARRAGVHAEHEPHVVFQTSTLDALFDGDFEGDLSFAELAQHGDLGLGTLDGLDGEMIALDGRFLRADPDGAITEIPPTAKTPFAVVTFFSPVVAFRIEEPLEHEAFLAALNRHAPPGSPSCAVRIDGAFELVRARSVPRQRPPYRSLAVLSDEQHVFELRGVRGTIVGFRFAAYAQGLEVPGYHLHFVDAERRRGGHVLACRPAGVDVGIDRASELHLELPPGIGLGPGQGSDARRAEIERLEGPG